MSRIYAVVDGFDFQKVWKAMCGTHWVWGSSGGVPSIAELKKNAIILLEQAIESKSWVRSGGFFADWNEGNLMLQFILEWNDFEMSRSQCPTCGDSDCRKPRACETGDGE